MKPVVQHGPLVTRWRALLKAIETPDSRFPNGRGPSALDTAAYCEGCAKNALETVGDDPVIGCCYMKCDRCRTS